MYHFFWDTWYDMISSVQNFRFLGSVEAYNFYNGSLNSKRGTIFRGNL